MKIFFIYALAATCFALQIKAQKTPNRIIPYDYQFYQKLNKAVYQKNQKFHSSIKDYYADDENIAARYDSLMRFGSDSLNRSFAHRKLFNEHLIQYQNQDYSIYADLLADFQIGRDIIGLRTTWLNTRGFQLGGTVGKTFSFYLNGFENQGKFPNYVNKYIIKNQTTPGQGYGKLSTDVQDWSYVSALLSYTPSKYINFGLGYGKNFIGDGYRSVLLSDVSSNYSFLRTRASLGSLQYQTIFAYMLDPGAEKLTNDRRLGDRGKWMAAHYLDWNITNRLSLGFFQAVTWADAEKEAKRSFDFNYIHPFVFLRPIESANTTSPDKIRLGLNAKYEALDKTAVYGQFMLDEFTAKEFFAGRGYWGNKFAIQLGLRGSDLFRIANLNYLAEFNFAKPYAYAHFNRISNYANYNQPLAHPYGANFREVLGIVNYSVGRFDFQGQALYANYGLDDLEGNFGKNIFKSYETRSVQYGSRVGQGINTDLYLAQGKIAYLLNPKYNLRIEIGGIYRQERNNLDNDRTFMFSFGLKSSFRNLYYDF